MKKECLEKRNRIGGNDCLIKTQDFAKFFNVV